jgi:hypothetical protein
MERWRILSLYRKEDGDSLERVMGSESNRIIRGREVSGSELEER